MRKDLPVPDGSIREFCRRHHIRALSLFGSALTERFSPESDIDTLVEFEPDDRIRLEHMLEAVREALSFVQGRMRTDLDADRMLLRALVKDIEIVGEAASRGSDETRTAFPVIPWEVIVATRNRLIHASFDINLDVLWETVAVDLPALERAWSEALTAGTQLGGGVARSG